ncbi:hypothetical protein M5K25_021130 [Dendrobium thyrsiflorum]|uniref:Uncharacterized protein n=1 Tax=Dendrobium thyrsiflorum TaxID=117978 RepID=A0ABD0UBN5_DENTH
MGNIDDKMQAFLCMATITTFQDLLDRVAKFEKLNLSKSESYYDKPKKVKASGARRGNANSTFFSRADMGKHVIYNIDKGKHPMQYEEKPKQGGGERPRQNMRTVKSTKRKAKLKKPKEKKAATQRVINSLEKYYQTARHPVKLADFMLGLKIDKAE